MVAYLKGYAGLTALVSTRIYPQPLPQGATLPAVTYKRISTPRVMSHSGASGLAMPRFQFDCWSEDVLEARQVANQVRIALTAFRGTMGGAGGVSVQGGFPKNELGDYDPTPGRYRAILDVVIHHQEATS